MPLKTPILGPFRKLVLVRLEDKMGEKVHFQPRSRSFCRCNKRCVRQNDLKLLASVAFPSPRPTFKGNPTRTLPGFLFGPIFPLGFSTLFRPSRQQGIGFPIVSVTLSGFRHNSESPKTHLGTVVRSLDQFLENPIPVGLPTSLVRIALSGFRQLSTT